MSKSNSLKLCFVLVVLLMLALVACAPSAAPTPTQEKGGTLVVGLDHEPSGLDPHADLYETIPTVVGGVYNTLIYRDLDGSYVPGLATSWEASDDGLSYTFKLREGVTFHDGTAFDAEAVKFSLDRIVNPDTKSRWAAGLLGPYSSSEVIDDHTVKIIMKEPYAPLFDSLSQMWLAIVSPTAVEKWGADYRLHQVGTGPFRFVEYVEKDHVTLERNPDYNWAPAHFENQGPASLDGIVFKFIPEGTTRIGTLETGETNLVNEVPPLDVGRLESDPSFEVYNIPLSGMPSGLFVNVSKEPTDDLRVRQALLYAVNREEIVQTLFADEYPPAYGPMEAETDFYDASLEDMYGYDPTQAEALLEEAGWMPGADGIREKDGESLNLVLLFWEQKELYELVQAQLKEVGVNAELQQLAPLAYIEASSAGEHHLTPIGGRRPLDPKWMTGFFKSGETYDWTKHSNARLDTLLGEGQSTLDPEQRQEIYAEIQQIIMGDAMFLPLSSRPDVYAVRGEVQGLSFDVRGDPNFYDVYLQD